MTRDEAHRLVDELFNMSEAPANSRPMTATELAESQDKELVNDSAPDRALPEGKRAVRTKTSGDRVYMLDEEKKTRQWVTNPEVLSKLGFEATDVVDVSDEELAGYQMAAAIYKLDEPS